MSTGWTFSSVPSPGSQAEGETEAWGCLETCLGLPQPCWASLRFPGGSSRGPGTGGGEALGLCIPRVRRITAAQRGRREGAESQDVCFPECASCGFPRVPTGSWACMSPAGLVGGGVLAWLWVTVGDHSMQTSPAPSALPDLLPGSAARCLPDVSHFLPAPCVRACVYFGQPPQ